MIRVGHVVGFMGTGCSTVSSIFTKIEVLMCVFRPSPGRLCSALFVFYRLPYL